EQAGRPGQFVARQGLAEKLIKQTFSVLRDLVKPILELPRSVHIIPTSFAADLSRRSAAISPALTPPVDGALDAYLRGSHGPESLREFRNYHRLALARVAIVAALLLYQYHP